MKYIIIKQNKVKYQIWKIVSQKKHPRKYLPKTWAYTNHSIFLKDLSGLQKLHLPLEDYMDGYFWLSLGKHIFADFCQVPFFRRPRRKVIGKNPAETQSMKIQLNSREINVGKNAGKIIQNVDNPRLTSQSTKLAWYPILKTQMLQKGAS